MTFDTAFNLFVVTVWLIAIIVGNILNHCGENLRVAQLFASTAMGFAAMACLRVQSILNFLKEKDHDIN